MSQQTNSPEPLQAEQRSSLSDGGESWQGVRGGDKVELGGEYGYLKGVTPAVRIMGNVVMVDDGGFCGGRKMVWLGGAGI